MVARRRPLSSIDQIDSSGGLAYFAPGVLLDSTATPASDVYALGTLFYQMLNGSLPFVHLQGFSDGRGNGASGC